MNEMPTYQVIIEIVSIEPLEDGELEAVATAVVEALHREQPFIALGPVATLDFENESIEILSTVPAANQDEVHMGMSKITDAMLRAANSFEYTGTSVRRVLEPAVA